MKRQTAFVLGGGGSLGALQVGALKALLSARILPDILVGTSAGAMNAAFLAMRGFNASSLDELERVWVDAAEADLLPSNYLWLTVRAIFQRPTGGGSLRIQNFCIQHGLDPSLCFEDLLVKLLVVATDLNTGRPVYYGKDPHTSVLEGVLASVALPPWAQPFEKDDQLLIDGALVSTLSIEAALHAQATEIVALDLFDERSIPTAPGGFGPFLSKVLKTVENRQVELEMALAAALDVPVMHIPLKGVDPVAIWDFSHTSELVDRGEWVARREIEAWRRQHGGWLGPARQAFRPRRRPEHG